MKIEIKGVGITPFGELWEEDELSLARLAVSQALADAQCEIGDIDVLIVGNMLLPHTSQQSHIGAHIASGLGFFGQALLVEGACASGGLAIRQALSLLHAKMAHRVLVVGVEKMSDSQPSETTAFLMGASSEGERLAGATFPGLYGMMHRKYQDLYGASDEEMCASSIKNHFHGSLNPKAHFQTEITTEQILTSAMIADPLRLLHCSPISDGAAAIILEATTRPTKGSVLMMGSGQGGDDLSLIRRKSITSLSATKKAFKQALLESDIKLSQIDVVELHDCFSIAEIMAIEDLGFVEAGKGAHALSQGFGRLGTKGVILNTSGGLKACGHPVGATGVKQVVEIAQQLLGRSGKRQVAKATFGLAHNVGGTGATAVVHVMGRSE